MEEVGVILICGVVGFATAKSSLTLKHKLHGSFDEVLPFSVIIGFLVLYLGYGLAFVLEDTASMFESWCPHHVFDFVLVSVGLLEKIGGKDIDAIITALLIGFVGVKVLDLIPIFIFLATSKKRKFSELILAPRRLAKAYEDNVLTRIISEEGDDFQRLQMEASGPGKHVLVTLSNRRLYYGMATFEPRHPQVAPSHGDYRQLRIIPLLSGYRDADERRVFLTDAHPPLKKKEPTSKKRTPSLIEIPYDKVVSIQFVEINFLLEDVTLGSKLQEFFKAQHKKEPETPILPGIET